MFSHAYNVIFLCILTGVTIKPLLHIFSLAIYQKQLFWSSWQTNSIIKYNGTHAITLRNSSSLPMGVRVFHSSQQKPRE